MKKFIWRRYYPEFMGDVVLEKKEIEWSNIQDPNSFDTDCKAIKFPFNIEKVLRWARNFLIFGQLLFEHYGYRMNFLDRFPEAINSFPNHAKVIKNQWHNSRIY